jgi:hypothetical protein
MADLQRKIIIQTEEQQGLYDKLHKFVARKKWTNQHKEQWCLQIISYLKQLEDYKRIDSLIKNKSKTEDITFVAFNLEYKRRFPNFSV